VENKIVSASSRTTMKIEAQKRFLPVTACCFAI
jgi:hypothetical protein